MKNKDREHEDLVQERNKELWMHADGIAQTMLGRKSDPDVLDAMHAGKMLTSMSATLMMIRKGAMPLSVAVNKGLLHPQMIADAAVLGLRAVRLSLAKKVMSLAEHDATEEDDVET